MVHAYGQSYPGWFFHYEIAGDFPLFQCTLSFGDDLICVQNWMLSKNTFFAPNLIEINSNKKSIFSKHLWMLVKLVYIVVLQVKYRPHRTNIVEMRAKSV
jgi:hypothetical protein